jgi:signal transduction histidine kinase
VRDPERLQALVDAMLLIESDLDLSTLLQSIVVAASQLVGARYGALGISSPDGSKLTNFITCGLTDEQRRRIGDMPRGHGLLGEVMLTLSPRRSTDLAHDPAAHGFPPGHPVMTTFLGVPVPSRDGGVFGNLYLTDRLDGEPFDDDDEALLESFGHAAGLIVDEARLREQLRELILAEERERLARDLHDTVIQRLFAIGLSLQSTLACEIDDDARRRLESAIDDLDETVREIRTSIFEITHDALGSSNGLRARVLAIIDEVTTRLKLPVDVRFEGPIDATVGPVLKEHVVNVLREL